VAVKPLGAREGRRRGPRYVVARMPGFRLERCGFLPEEPAILMEEQHRVMRVLACTPAAHQRGIRPGMRAAEARALCADLKIEPLDRAAEDDDRQAMVQAFETLVDRVGAWGLDGVVLEVSTLSTWGTDDASLLQRVAARAEELGHEVGVAISDHPLAAAALAAQVGARVVVPPGEGAVHLAPLPWARLTPSEELTHAWSTLGLRTIGQVAALDAASVAGRYGEEGAALHRVAQGAPGLPWARLPRPAEAWNQTVDLDDECQQLQPLVEALQRAATTWEPALLQAELRAAVVRLTLTFAWGPPFSLEVRPVRPVLRGAMVRRLLEGRLTATSWSAPVVAFRLAYTHVLPDQGEQPILWSRHGAHEPLEDVLQRVSDVLGAERVFQPRLLPSWQPEAAWQPVGVLGPPGRPAPVIEDPVACQDGHQWSAPLPRPTLLYPLPRPVRVDAADDGRPQAMWSSPGGWLRFEKVSEVEHLEGLWWDPAQAFERRYYVVQLPQGSAWIFEERSQWFLHGWFD